MGIVCARCEKTPAAKECIIEAQTVMSMEVHHSHVLTDDWVFEYSPTCRTAQA